MNSELDRFIKAQEEDFNRALREIRSGRKLTHWMWYIFPQITGLGISETAKYYEIKSLKEARDYLQNQMLRINLIKITNELLKLETNNPVDVFGDVDSLKLKSSMTLFFYISNGEIFKKALDKYFDGMEDEKTIKICENLEW